MSEGWSRAWSDRGQESLLQIGMKDTMQSMLT